MNSQTRRVEIPCNDFSCRKTLEGNVLTLRLEQQELVKSAKALCEEMDSTEWEFFKDMIERNSAQS